MLNVLSALRAASDRVEVSSHSKKGCASTRVSFAALWQNQLSFRFLLLIEAWGAVTRVICNLLGRCIRQNVNLHLNGFYSLSSRALFGRNACFLDK